MRAARAKTGDFKSNRAARRCGSGKLPGRHVSRKNENRRTPSWIPNKFTNFRGGRFKGITSVRLVALFSATVIHYTCSGTAVLILIEHFTS